MTEASPLTADEQQQAEAAGSRVRAAMEVAASEIDAVVAMVPRGAQRRALISGHLRMVARIAIEETRGVARELGNESANATVVSVAHLWSQLFANALDEHAQWASDTARLGAPEEMRCALEARSEMERALAATAREQTAQLPPADPELAKVFAELFDGLRAEFAQTEKDPASP